jgi:hypothetical protein
MSAATITLVPASPVDAALNYAAFAKDGTDGGYPALWSGKYPSQAAGDKVIGLHETQTRPHACMQILADEVRRLRAQLQEAGK